MLNRMEEFGSTAEEKWYFQVSRLFLSVSEGENMHKLLPTSQIEHHVE